MKNTHDKIIVSIDTMISDAILRLQFYGEFCQFINFSESHTIGTCGVTVEVGGMRFFFDSEFLNELSQEEVNFVVIHEIFHLLWNHQARTRRLGYDYKLSNVVQDMIINTVIKTDIIDKMKYFNKREGRSMSFVSIPKDKDKKTWVLELPVEYKGQLIYEELYEWLLKAKEKYNEWKNYCKDLDKKDKKPALPVSSYLKEIFDQLEMGIEDFLDKHLSDDIPDEYRKDIIDNIKNVLKNRGLLSADIQLTLDKITKSKKDYIKGIKIGINELFGDYKNKSISKRNRRSIPGIKGKRKDAYALNVILDTSGSMSGYMEKALSYVFQNGLTINLIQCDTKVNKYTVIKDKFQFKKLEIIGMGGTTLQPGIDYISNNKQINKLNTLILTDGYCEYLNTDHLKKVLIISHGIQVKTSSMSRSIVIK
jgi:predicted metal-dependent peptidase